jgi:lipase maturation factor 1
LNGETQPSDTVNDALSSAGKERTTAPSSFSISSWTFQRALAIAYIAAFASMAFQITGLIGHNGILPVDRLTSYLKLAHEGFFTLGSFAWFNSSDAFLQGLCWAGVVSGCLVFAGVLTPLALICCWLLWMSIVNIGQDFLCFQWDILLLEVGFLSIFMAPWRLFDWPFRKGKPAEFSTPHIVSVWLFRWLLFRLMLESGLCKLNSGDITWSSLTALNYHFHTQPLPTPLAWFADKLPDFALQFSTLMTFVIELAVPFFVFLKQTRVVGACLLMFLQVVIALTGNYAFFNLLTFALCLFLIDDSAWTKLFRALKNGNSLLHRRLKPAQVAVGAAEAMSEVKVDSVIEPLNLRKIQLPQKIMAIFAAVVISVVSFVQLLSHGTNVRLPEVVQTAVGEIGRFYIFNSYGLFATMTTNRDEIVVEGSLDGTTWKEYEFAYKPGNIFMPPCMVAPAQPRLDWQMWFASLADLSQSPWFVHFIGRLFDQSPEVLGLLKTNPFPGKAPVYLRARLFRYTFSDWGELCNGGQWWRSQYRGDFLPEVSANAVLRRNAE